MKFVNKLSDLVGNYLTVIVVVVVAVALTVPSAFVWAVPKTSLLLGVIMFGMGMTLDMKDFRSTLKNPRYVFIGCAFQFTIMPFSAFFLAKAFHLPPELAVGVVLVGTCPGGTTSNVITYLSKGDVALSVAMTTASTLLAPVMTPLLTWLLAGQWLAVSFMTMFMSVVKVILVPILLGLVAHKLLGGWVTKLQKLLVLVSASCIMVILGGVVGNSASQIFTVGLLVLVVVLAQNLLGYFLGYLGSRALHLNPEQTKAVAIEVGMQNTGLACSLAAANFSPTVAVPGAIATVCHQITGSVLASVFGRMSKREALRLSHEQNVAAQANGY